MAEFTGDAGNNTLTGGIEADTLLGLAGADTLIGGANDDLLDGGTGADSMTGGTGNDTYIVDDLGDVVVEAAGEGTDTVVSSISYTLTANVEVLDLRRASGGVAIDGTGNALNNIIHGNDSGSSTGGSNKLYGLDGADTLFGYNGSDTLDGGTGIDSMVGGTGSDTYYVDNALDVVVEAGADAAAEGQQDRVITGLATYTLGNFIENLTLTGAGQSTGNGNALNNTLIGNDGNSELYGGAGNDVLRGAASIDTLGDDTLDGGAGSDHMTGGKGNDTYYVETAELRDANDDIIVAGDIVVEGNPFGGGGTDTVHTAINNYTLTDNVENLIFGAGVITGNGNGEANTITGNDLDNVINGGGDADTLYGGAGNDTLDGGLQNDNMQGGAGNDVYYVNSSGDVTDETTGSGVDTVIVTAGSSHTLGTGIENLTITAAGTVSGTGNVLANTMIGGDGNNNLSGGDGADTISGGLGADTLNGGAGIDSLTGGAGDDLYVLDSTSDVIVEAVDEGTDSVQIAATYTLSANVENLTLGGTGNFNGTGSNVANILTGNSGDNILSGGDGADTLIGDAGADVLDGGTGADSLKGGLGDDVYVIDNSADVIDEVAGQGTFDEVHTSVNHALGLHVEHMLLTGTGNINGTGNASNNIIEGNSGNNTISGANGADTLSGFGGNDRIDGGAGTDSMAGGTGNDTYVVDVATDVVIELAAAGTDTVETALAYTLAANFENLTLTGSAAVAGTGNTVANVLSGNAGNNTLSGLDGDDTLNGGAGNDVLNGGTGNDSMTGGLGNDTYYIDAAGDVAVEAASGGADTIRTIFTTTLAANFENLVLTGSADLNGTGNSVANRISGNGGANSLSGLVGDDTLSGGAGADTLDGGAGNDSMVGGAGNDTYVVDATADKIVEVANGGTDQVNASASYTLVDGVENITLTGSSNINATGNSAANTMVGNSGDNTLNGAAGNDNLTGNGGNDALNGGRGTDTMAGGTGDDTYYVNVATDVIVEVASAGTDTVRATSSVTLAANVENLVMLGTGTYTGTGNGLANTMTGNTAVNTLKGMAGNDILDGKGGADVLTGGTGADHFVFSSATAGNDTITDFNAVDGGAAEGDKMVFDGLLVGTFVYRGASAFSGGSDNSEARFDATSGRLQIDVDGNGTFDFALKLTGMDAATDVTATDFLWS